MNTARANGGLGALAKNVALTTLAQTQAVRMAKRNAIFHNDNLKADADASGLNWRWIGENVGVGPDAKAIHEGFMASAPHRANVLRPSYNAIGVGVVAASDGSVFIAHVFADVSAKPAPVMARPANRPAPAVKVAPAQPSPTQRPAPVPHHATGPSKSVATPVPNAVVGGIVTTIAL